MSLDEIDESLIARGRAKVTEVELDGESILYDDATQELLVLNGSAGVIWQNLDGACSLRELIADLADVFEVDADIVRADVLDTVRELSRHGMLEAAAAPASEPPDMIWRTIGEPAFLVEGPVGCASCVERLDELEWGDTITFEIGGVHIGVRTNAPEVDAVLRLALGAYLADDVEAPANFSLRIGEQQGRGREGLHILYDASEQLARSSAPSRVVSALFAHLASHEASYEAGTDDGLLPLRIPAVVVGGVAVLVSRHLRPILLDVEPRLRASGLELVESPVLTVDTATRELVVTRPAIALDPGTPMALTELDRTLSTRRSAPDPRPKAAIRWPAGSRSTTVARITRLRRRGRPSWSSSSASSRTSRILRTWRRSSSSIGCFRCTAASRCARMRRTTWRKPSSTRPDKQPREATPGGALHDPDRRDSRPRVHGRVLLVRRRLQEHRDLRSHHDDAPRRRRTLVDHVDHTAGTREGAEGRAAGPASRDCSVDVTAALQAWIDSKPDNSVLPFPAHACYRIDETLFVENRHGLTFEGNGVVLKAVSLGDRTRSHFVLTGGSNLTVRNVVVRGSNFDAGADRGAYHPDLEAQHAFGVSGATNVLLDHVQAYDLYGDFVYIGPGKNNVPSRNVRVIGSHFERSGRQGISIVHAENVTIQGNEISEVARSMFDIEPNDPRQKARSIRIIGNVTGRAANFWLADKGALASIGDILISGNRMTEPTGGLIFVFVPGGAYRGPFVIENNQFIANDRVSDESSSGAFFFTHAENVTIRNNDVTFPSSGDMPAVELRDSHHVQVTGNTFTNAGETMLATEGSSDYHVS